MTARAAWPSGKKIELSRPADNAGGRWPPAQALPDQGPAHAVIGEMADLLRDSSASMTADGGMLAAITIGLALETGLSARALHASPADALNLGVLCALLTCWLAAVLLLARAGRPMLSAVSELRWVTGAPVEPRAKWLTLPPAGADPAQWTWNRAYLLLGAARAARHRMQLADTWTYLAVGCFLVWTMIIILGL